MRVIDAVRGTIADVSSACPSSEQTHVLDHYDKPETRLLEKPRSPKPYLLTTTKLARFSIPRSSSIVDISSGERNNE